MPLRDQSPAGFQAGAPVQKRGLWAVIARSPVPSARTTQIRWVS
jgi:hypothetical protein